MHTHYTQFMQYTPTDAQLATLYWKSKEGADWRVAKEILLQDSSLTALMYNPTTGKTEQVTKDLSTVVPTGKSVLILNLDDLAYTGVLQAGYIIKNGEIVEIDVEEIYREKWEAIKALRTKKKEGGVFIQSLGKWFHSDADSQKQIHVLVTLNTLGQYKGQMWKTMDNSFVSLSSSGLLEVFGTIINREKITFEVAETHNNLMRSCADPVNYDITTMWPQTYAESVGASNV